MVLSRDNFFIVCRLWPIFSHSTHQGESLREIPFSHGPFLRHNGAQERSIIPFTELLSHCLSSWVIRGTDSPGKQFLDMEFIFYIFVYKYLDDRSGEQYYSSMPPSLSAYVGYSTEQLYSTTLKLLHVQYLHYKPVLNHFCRGGGGEVGELWALVLFSTPVILLPIKY